MNLANHLGAIGKRHQDLGELACLGIFAKMPNAAKHSQLGQVTPSHTKSHQEMCHLPDVVKDDKKDAYQDSVTASLSREHNDDVGGDTKGLEENIIVSETLREVLTVILKVCSYMAFV